MKAKPCLRLLAAAFLAALAVSAEAQTLADCGLQARLPQFVPSDKDPIVITLLGDAGACTSVRVAAVGEAGILGLAQPAGALNIILAERPAPSEQGSCPAISVPFEIEVRLPERLPAVEPPGLFPIGVYRRSEDEHGNLASQVSCGVVDLSVSAGYRSEVPFHEGRFVASVTWNTSGQNENGFAVPADGTATDSALFWFFQPGNWELMVKVLDGCAVNQHYWVIGAAATHLRYTLRIADTHTGTVWTHTHPVGQLAPAFADVEAFPCAGTAQ
jgi:hypothetical protein